MDAMTIAQIANPFIQTVFIVIIGLGYFFTIKTLRGQVQEAFQARITGGRPLIIVSEDYENLPTINLIVQNVGPGAREGHQLPLLLAHRELGRLRTLRADPLSGGDTLARA